MLACNLSWAAAASAEPKPAPAVSDEVLDEPAVGPRAVDLAEQHAQRLGVEVRPEVELLRSEMEVVDQELRRQRLLGVLLDITRTVGTGEAGIHGIRWPAQGSGQWQPPVPATLPELDADRRSQRVQEM